MPYSTHIALLYPHGRIHDETYITPEPLAPGTEFELYGHRWQAVGWTSADSRTHPIPATLVCKDVAPSGPIGRVAA